MTQKKAMEIFTKLVSKMNYNDRRNQEYAGGLSKSYYRAHRLLTTEPIFDPKDQRPITHEELAQIRAALLRHNEVTYEHLTNYLFANLVSNKNRVLSELLVNPCSPKNPVEETGQLLQIIYYLGCIKGINASLAIINQIEGGE